MVSFILVGNKDNRKLTDSAKDLYYEFIDKYNYSEEEITWHLARKGIEFQGIENILFDFQDYILDHIHEYGFSYENEDYEFIESKKSTRKSIKESKGSINFGDLLSSQIDYNKDDDNVLYYIFVNNKEYGSFFKWEIYNSHRELLQLDVFKWDIESKGVLHVNLH